MIHSIRSTSAPWIIISKHSTHALANLLAIHVNITRKNFAHASNIEALFILARCPVPSATVQIQVQVLHLMRWRYSYDYDWWSHAIKYHMQSYITCKSIRLVDVYRRVKNIHLSLVVSLALWHIQTHLHVIIWLSMIVYDDCMWYCNVMIACNHTIVYDDCIMMIACNGCVHLIWKMIAYMMIACNRYDIMAWMYSDMYPCTPFILIHTLHHPLHPTIYHPIHTNSCMHGSHPYSPFDHSTQLRNVRNGNFHRI